MEQMAFAVAVRAAETIYWFVSFADSLGGFAFFRFTRFFEEHFHNFYFTVVQ